jgi:superfamily II DNA helicase RecQ
MSAKVNKENFEWEQSKFLNLESNNRPVKWVFNDIKNNEAEYIKYTNNTNKIIKVLNDTFKLKKFHRLQFAAINAVLNGDNVYVQMPTGAGKSLIYQLPGQISDSVTIVICPLLSLIEDQVNKLKLLNIPVAAYDLTVGQPLIDFKLIYITPEKFITNNFIYKIKYLYNNKKLKRVVIDEAHCVSFIIILCLLFYHNKHLLFKFNKR